MHTQHFELVYFQFQYSYFKKMIKQSWNRMHVKIYLYINGQSINQDWTWYQYTTHVLLILLLLFTLQNRVSYELWNRSWFCISIYKWAGHKSRLNVIPAHYSCSPNTSATFYIVKSRFLQILKWKLILYRK